MLRVIDLDLDLDLDAVMTRQLTEHTVCYNGKELDLILVLILDPDHFQS